MLRWPQALPLLVSIVWITALSGAEPLLQIQDVRVGFSRQNEDYIRFGAWVPVAVELSAARATDLKGTLSLETADSDGVTTVYEHPFDLEKEATAGGASRAVVVITVKYTGGRLLVRLQGTDQQFTYPDLRRGVPPIDLSHLEKALKECRQRIDLTQRQMKDIRQKQEPGWEKEYSTLETRLNSDQEQAVTFETEIDDEQADTQAMAPFPVNQRVSRKTALVLLLGPSFGWKRLTSGDDAEVVRFAQEDQVSRLPRDWSAYGSVDTIILPTGGDWESSVARQLADHPERAQAIARWVRMGGHLVLATARNCEAVGKPEFALGSILPVRIVAPARIEYLSGLHEGMHASKQSKILQAPLAPLVKRGLSMQLVQATSKSRADSIDQPAIVTGPVGLGRVTVIGFDLDSEEFRHWPSRKEFWNWLLDISASEKRQAQNRILTKINEDEPAYQLIYDLETVPGLGSVSFPLVAAIILLYVVVVGPLDYLLLSRVLGRMYFTWITFPALVILVLYFAWQMAGQQKGDTVRINKLDTVDIDMSGTSSPQVYGSSHFTVFAPELNHFTFALQPRGFEAESLNLGWLVRPSDELRGRTAVGTSLFPRRYGMHLEEAEVADVPIQVWSVKSFESRWLGQADSVPFEHDLERRQSGTEANYRPLLGSITWRLPLPLEQPQLLFGKRVWTFPTMEPGKKVTIPDDNGGLDLLRVRGEDSASVVRRALYHKNTNKTVANPTLEYLDQSWKDSKFGDSLLVLTGKMSMPPGSLDDLKNMGMPGTAFDPFKPGLRSEVQQQTVVRITFSLGK